MKKTLIVISSLVLLQSAVAQVIRDHRKDPKTTGNPKTIPVMDNPGGNVILYEHAKFSGQSKSFGVGTYRFHSTADFNDLASSIKVPPGLAVMIYEHASEKGGYGSYADLLEDCPDLSVYNFNDKVSFINVFTVEKTGGYVWARGRMANGNVVPGHWERKRANGVLPDNAPPAVVLAVWEQGDMANAQAATQAEIDEFNDVTTHQMGIGVLGGETTAPFYYHHNQSGETVYKYNKIIDPARLPGGFFDWASEKLGWAGIVVKPFEVITDVAGDIKDWIFGSSSTKMAMDCWYPVSEYKKTVCGKMTKDASICTQDYLHTQVTVDKDVCYYLKPSEKFSSFLTNRWTNETSTIIEGEVKSLNLRNVNTQTGKSTETTTPRNPLLLQLKKDENVCLFGPWMGDILDINLKVPIPFTDSKIELANIDLRKNNEIHPVNQFWKKKGTETLLTAIVDETGYFEKTGNRQVAASGLNQRMRFYIAFLVPAPGGPKVVMNNNTTFEYDINGVGFNFTENSILDIQPETLTLKNQGVVKVKVNAHSFVRLEKTFRVFFDKVRKRPNGAIQGYVVIETEPITKKGGSINITVNDRTINNSPVGPLTPVKVLQ